MGITQGAID